MNRHVGLIMTVTAGAILLLLCSIGFVLPMLGSPALAACGSAPQPAAPGAPDKRWSPLQQQRAATIIGAGQRTHVPPRGWVIAIATAMQESSLRNLANTGVPASMAYPHDGAGHDHDSLGLFQQRPNPPAGKGSWGTVAELMNPDIATEKFYNALAKIQGWQQMRLTDAAQAVQHSAYPQAYQKWEQPAEALVAALAGVTSVEQIAGGAPPAPCGTDTIPAVAVGPQGWTQPVHAAIVSPYGQRAGRLHAGDDLGAARNTPIHVAAAGTVIKVRCDSGIGTCDRDGGTNVSGCGWYVEVRHTLHLWYQGHMITDVITRYCHMGRRPSVTVGQTVAAGTVLGFVGSSGHSSGPHLHFEVHLTNGEPADNVNSTDPAPWMAAVGAPLGR
ncbi:M23 family metallopeptidase [Hamadaea tsunoensis]